MDCSICFKRLSRIHLVLPCGHNFHFNCLDQWYNFKPRLCPYCRQMNGGGVYSRLRSKKKLIINIVVKCREVNLTINKEDKVYIMLEIFKLLNKSMRVLRFENIILFETIKKRIEVINNELQFVTFNSMNLKDTLSYEMEITKKNIDKLVYN